MNFNFNSLLVSECSGRYFRMVAALMPITPPSFPAPHRTMYKLVLVRHGESTWNLENRFTGWTDVDLTPTGLEQAKTGRRAQGRGL
jgi:hypothetical protein